MGMRFSTRLKLAFLAVSLVPVGTILGLTWYTVETRFDQEYAERINDMKKWMSSWRDRNENQLKKKITALSDSGEIEKILLDILHNNLDRSSLGTTAKALMDAWDLDMLTILDGDGVVLSCGHNPGRRNKLDKQLLAFASDEPMSPEISWRSFLKKYDQKIVSEKRLVVQLGRVKTLAEAKVALVGGIILDENFFARQLETVSNSSVALIDDSGKEIVSGPRWQKKFEGWILPDKASSGWVKIQFTKNTKLVAWLPRDKLEETQKAILIFALLAAVLGVVGSWLLGMVLSRRISMPLRALLNGTRLVGEGDLKQRVPGNFSGEFGVLVNTFNAMLQNLESYQERLVRAERVAAWQEIARRIAHEIKNPLSPIQVSIETMQKAYSSGHPDFPVIFDESTKAIIEEVGALKRIVTEFSNFARLPQPVMTVGPLNDIVESVVSLFKNTEENLEVSFVAGQNLPDVPMDKELIGRVLNNLMSNACQAVSNGGKVVVSTGMEGDRCFVRVQDDGCGMDSEVVSKIFTPYFTTRQNGTGLGLAIAQRIIQEHGGSIEVQSTRGQGTTVWVFLPRDGDSLR